MFWNTVTFKKKNHNPPGCLVLSHPINMPLFPLLLNHLHLSTHINVTLHTEVSRALPLPQASPPCWLLVGPRSHSAGWSQRPGSCGGLTRGMNQWYFGSVKIQMEQSNQMSRVFFYILLNIYCSIFMRSKGQKCVFTRRTYVLYFTAMNHKKSQVEVRIIPLHIHKFIDVENQAILKFNKELGGANNSTTLRSISFIFHVCQNSIMQRFTKAKQ